MIFPFLNWWRRESKGVNWNWKITDDIIFTMRMFMDDPEYTDEDIKEAMTLTGSTEKLKNLTNH